MIGVPDKMLGQRIKAFVVLKKGVEGDEELKKNLNCLLKKIMLGMLIQKKLNLLKVCRKLILEKL